MGALRLLDWGTKAVIGANVTQFLGWLAIFGATSTFRGPGGVVTIASVRNLENAAALSGLLFALALIVSLAGGTLGLAGAVKMREGSVAFKPEHRAAVNRGILFLFAAAAVFVVIGLWNFSTESLLTGTIGDSSSVPFGTAMQGVIDNTLGTAVLGCIATLLAAIGMGQLVAHLEAGDEGGETRGFFVASMVGPLLLLLASFSVASKLGTLTYYSTPTPAMALVLLDALITASAAAFFAEMIGIIALSKYLSKLRSAAVGARRLAEYWAFNASEAAAGAPPAGPAPAAPGPP